MDSYDRSLRRRDFVIVIGLMVAVCLAIAAVARGDRLVLGPDGELTYLTLPQDPPRNAGYILRMDDVTGQIEWNECVDCDGPDKVVMFDENGKCFCTEVSEAIPIVPHPQSTYFLPFPDGTTWTEGQPSPWVKREEFEAFQKWVEINCMCPGTGPYYPNDSWKFQYNQNKGE